MLADTPGSVRALAHQLGVGRTSVSDWRAGRAVPADDLRLVLQRECGIPVRAWDERGELSVTSDDESTSDVDLSMSLDVAAVRTLRARQVLLEAQGAGATTTEIVNISKEVRAHRQDAEKHAIGREAFERRVEEAVMDPAKQPFYQRAINAVVDALKPHPEALADVLAALDAAAEMEADA